MNDERAADEAWDIAFGDYDPNPERECTCSRGAASNLFDCLCPRHAHLTLKANRGLIGGVLYSHYLASDRWHHKTRVVRAGECALCPNPVDDVHHRTYDRIGDEEPTDLIGLCRECHARHHAKVT